MITKKIIIETGLGGWTNSGLDSWKKFKYGLGQKVRCTVPENLQSFGIAGGYRFELAIVVGRIAQIQKLLTTSEQQRFFFKSELWSKF